MILRFRRAHIIAAVFTVLVIAAAVLVLQHGNAEDSVLADAKDQTACEKALIYLFMDSIQKQSDDFYGPYYTENPEIAYFTTTVKEVREEGSVLYITFSTLPYIGPHDTIGEDEITFSLTSSGEITPIGLKHVKNYALPDNLADMLRGTLPPITES